MINEFRVFRGIGSKIVYVILIRSDKINGVISFFRLSRYDNRDRIVKFAYRVSVHIVDNIY